MIVLIRRQSCAAHRIVLVLAILFSAVAAMAGQDEDRWWPVQSLPGALVRTPISPRDSLQMMVQSVAGLAAKAVNTGRGDEMVWVDNANVDMEEWYARLFVMHPEVQKRGTFGPWELVDRYARLDIVKGYILYRLDKTQGDGNNAGNGLDCSVNVATSMAGLLDGVLVDETLETEAQAHGLKLLLDARGKTQQWCFQTYQGQFNRRMLCLQDPRKPHIRDLAIAQRTFTAFGHDASIPAAMKWLEPLSPILGCNGGDEFENTGLSTRYGDIQTATDWCMNLPVLMAGTEKLNRPIAKTFDPATIDWSDQRSAVSFIDSDGDNVQWFEGNFFHGSDSYWHNPNRGKTPFSWSCCFAQLAQLCPEAVEYAMATRTTNDSFVEWGGGYYYPDHFGLDRTNRWELLGRQARRTWKLMKKTGTRIIGFNVIRCDSPEAREAYEVFARQTDGLLAILAFQYSPYEGGAGQTFWVKDSRGIDVPVITARYSIWANSNDRERAGTPARIAR